MSKNENFGAEPNYFTMYAQQTGKLSSISFNRPAGLNKYMKKLLKNFEKATQWTDILQWLEKVQPEFYSGSSIVQRFQNTIHPRKIATIPKTRTMP